MQAGILCFAFPDETAYIERSDERFAAVVLTDFNPAILNPGSYVGVERYERRERNVLTTPRLVLTIYH